MGKKDLYCISEDGEVAEIESKPFDLEKSLQDLVERNLEELLGITFLDSEYSTGPRHSGRIDTLGLDENDSPIIIEYKKKKSQNVMKQGLYYLDWLVNNRAEFEDLVREEIGVDVEVDWSSPRLVCIAPDFQKYDSRAVGVIEQNIELIRFQRYSDGILLLELVNAGESSEAGQSGPSDYTTVAEKREQASENLTRIFREIDEFALSLGDDIQKKEQKYYYAYKRIQNFLCVRFRPKKDQLQVGLKINPDELDQMPEIAKDITDTGDFGSMTLKLTITDGAGLETSKEYIQMSYERV